MNHAYKHTTRNYNGYQGQAAVDAATARVAKAHAEYVATIQGQAPGVPIIKARETGARTAVVCVLPFKGGASDEVAHRALCNALARDFGGFTRTKVEGGWIDEDDDGTLQLDAAWRYEVSFVPSARAFERARELFIVTGAATGQTWIHIENHPLAFKAAHVKI